MHTGSHKNMSLITNMGCYTTRKDQIMGFFPSWNVSAINCSKMLRQHLQKSHCINKTACLNLTWRSCSNLRSSLPCCATKGNFSTSESELVDVIKNYNSIENILVLNKTYTIWLFQVMSSLFWCKTYQEPIHTPGYPYPWKNLGISFFLH